MNRQEVYPELGVPPALIERQKQMMNRQLATGVTMYKDPWDVLYRAVLETRIGGEMLRGLLEHGSLAVLQGLATASFALYEPPEVRDLHLPWYKDTVLGKGAWWNVDARPYTVKEWVDDTAKEHEHRKLVAAMAHNQDFLRSAQPSLLLFDSDLGISIIADGCKRACARYIAKVASPFLVFTSPHARMFFPCDFIPHLKP
ncbi:MAG: hypothetical protein V3W51_04725 [Candidatus Brocadiales bacterium]